MSNKFERYSRKRNARVTPYIRDNIAKDAKLTVFGIGEELVAALCGSLQAYKKTWSTSQTGIGFAASGSVQDFLIDSPDEDKHELFDTTNNFIYVPKALRIFIRANIILKVTNVSANLSLSSLELVATVVNGTSTTIIPIQALNFIPNPVTATTDDILICGSLEHSFKTGDQITFGIRGTGTITASTDTYDVKAGSYLNIAATHWHTDF